MLIFGLSWTQNTILPNLYTMHLNEDKETHPFSSFQFNSLQRMETANETETISTPLPPHNFV